MAEKQYLMLTKNQMLIGKAILERIYSGDIMALRVIDGNPEKIGEEKELHLIADKVEEKPILCRIAQRKGNYLEVAKMGNLDANLRTSFRAATSFDTYIYPISGQWKGRRKARTLDIACGGIGFLSDSDFAIGEIAEIVITNMRHPLIVQMKILRKKPEKEMAYQYGAEFVDLCPGEEQELCHAVFNVQVEERRFRAAIS